MFGARVVVKRNGRDEAEKPFWISFADLMTALMVLFLVVMLVYCAVQAFWDVEPKRLALGVFVFACMIEVAQWFQLADVLHLTGWARVVLGTSFSFHDIVMYAAGCLAVYWLDKKSSF